MMASGLVALHVMLLFDSNLLKEDMEYASFKDYRDSGIVDRGW